MDNPTFGFLIYFVLAGFGCMGLAVPLIRRKIGLNGWYGFRTPRTMSNELIWYGANAYMGKLLLGWGAAVVLASILLYLIPALREDLAGYNLSVAGIVLGGLALIFALGVRYARTLDGPPAAIQEERDDTKNRNG